MLPQVARVAVVVDRAVQIQAEGPVAVQVEPLLFPEVRAGQVLSPRLEEGGQQMAHTFSGHFRLQVARAAAGERGAQVAQMETAALKFIREAARAAGGRGEVLVLVQ